MTLAERTRAQLEASGYWADVLSSEPEDAGCRGAMVLDVIGRLQKDTRFARGVFYALHRDVGDRLHDFRSRRGTFGRGSLQIVIDECTGKFWADIDRFSPYDDLVGTVGHFFGAVIPDWIRKPWRSA